MVKLESTDYKNLEENAFNVDALTSAKFQKARGKSC
jgi:hypothetical protein